MQTHVAPNSPASTCVVVRYVERFNGEECCWSVPYATFQDSNKATIRDFAMDTIDEHNTGSEPVIDDAGVIDFKSVELR